MVKLNHFCISVLLLLSVQVSASPILFSMDEMFALKGSIYNLELKFASNELELGQQAARIAQLQEGKASSENLSEEEQDEQIRLTRDAQANMCQKMLHASKSSSDWRSVFGKVLSGFSSVFTVLGPCYEFFHNYKLYARTNLPIPYSAYGWPIFDFISNGFFVASLGVEYSESDNFSDFIWNAIPSLMVMAVEVGMVFELSIFQCRRKMERIPLLPVN